MISELLEARGEYSRRFRRIRALGIGVGLKCAGIQRTADLSVQVFVDAKRTRRDLALRERIPASIDGIPIDVVETPPAQFSCGTRADAHSAVRTLRLGRSKYRPLKAGVSCSNLYTCSGTLGAFCEGLNRKGRPARFILSCGHVLRSGGSHKTSPSIVQASPADGGTSRDTVAVFDRDIPLLAGDEQTNVGDAAVAELMPGIECRNEIIGVGGLGGKSEPQLGMRVVKAGRTTGVTSGVITSVALETTISWVRDSAISYRFMNLFRIEPDPIAESFALPGDSGSLVVTADDRRATGLYFAGSDDGTYGLAVKISTIEERLDIRLSEM